MNEKQQKAHAVYVNMKYLKRNVDAIDYYCYKITKLFDELERATREDMPPKKLEELDFDFEILNSNIDSEIYRLAKTLSCMAPHMADELAEIFLKTKEAHEGAK